MDDEFDYDVIECDDGWWVVRDTDNGLKTVAGPFATEAEGEAALEALP